jgi:hypothetical protein
MQKVRSNQRILRAPKRRHMTPIDKVKAHEVIWQQVAPICEAVRLVNNAAFVYLIGEPDNGPLKIGSSKDPVGRLRTMQTGNSRRLRIEHLLIGDPNLEKLLHEIWREHAIISARNTGKVDAPAGTEWFDPTVRDELEPIIRTAAEKQITYLKTITEDQQASFDDFATLVREAHGDHDFVIKGRDIPLLLGQTVGYVRPRMTRI